MLKQPRQSESEQGLRNVIYAEEKGQWARLPGEGHEGGVQHDGQQQMTARDGRHGQDGDEVLDAP